jgi:hypothetical protein
MKREVMEREKLKKGGNDTYFGCIGWASLLSRAEESWISTAMTKTMALRKARAVAVDFIFGGVVCSSSLLRYFVRLVDC